ncbi:MAG: DNA cytosine methyltransferase [Synergistaceae bacterium]|jgi:DNA (cytosine-5)-methyltransferase 1|nr:DNA cytosine methyltransferase [Synergistaceae bacterium]
MPQYRLGELFCGPGGIAYGAVTAEIDDPEYRIIHQWATDYDRDTCNTYLRNICPGADSSVICADIRKLNLDTLSEIDALAFGFPCNDYSVVGEQKGMGGVYGPLYSYGVAALKRFKPKWFLAENVGGLRSANYGKAFAKILDDMRSAGYTLTPHLYKFEEYGVPQARHRIIIVGIKDGEGIAFKVPSASLRVREDNSCRAAIEEPPIPAEAPNSELTNQSVTVIRRLRHIKAGENAFTADLPEDLRLNVTGAKISQIYKRLDPNKPAYTVTGSGGGGTHIYHWSEPRALTNRERARLQTFPDDYVFQGSKESVRKQIGMAVPCDGARIIFEAILNSFAGIPYEWVAPNINE